MTSLVELFVFAEYEINGIYTPARVNGPYEDCYPAEYPDLEINPFLEGSKIELTDADYEAVHSMVEKDIDYARSEFPRFQHYKLEAECCLDLCGQIWYNGQNITHLLQGDEIIEAYRWAE